VNTNIHYRDGSVGFFNNTDLNGYAASTKCSVHELAGRRHHVDALQADRGAHGV